MKKIIVILVVFILTGCCDTHKPVNKNLTHKALVNNAAAPDSIEKQEIRYSDQQLEMFLDSVGHLSTKTLADKAAFYADSVFRNQRRLDTLISPSDIKILKHAAHKGMLSVKAARRIFNNNHISYDCNTKSIFLTYKVGLIPVVYYPFNISNGEYGICIGDPDHCENAYLYFFKGDRIIARHDLYQRHSDKLRWFKGEDGESVVYYCKEFTEGSGIWWFNYYFYKYEDGKLIPALNIPQNINLIEPSPWGVREIWFESIIKKPNPLTVKMVYHQQLPDTATFDHYTSNPQLGPMIVNDSTVVKYSWDKQTKSFRGNYEQSKINEQEILSYYLVDNELLTINVYYKKLKLFLSNKKKIKSTLHYLNEIKNYSDKKR